MIMNTTIRTEKIYNKFYHIIKGSSMTSVGFFAPKPSLFYQWK